MDRLIADAPPADSHSTGPAGSDFIRSAGRLRGAFSAAPFFTAESCSIVRTPRGLLLLSPAGRPSGGVALVNGAAGRARFRAGWSICSQRLGQMLGRRIFVSRGHSACHLPGCCQTVSRGGAALCVFTAATRLQPLHVHGKRHLSSSRCLVAATPSGVMGAMGAMGTLARFRPTFPRRLRASRGFPERVARSSLENQLFAPLAHFLN